MAKHVFEYQKHRIEIDMREIQGPTAKGRMIKLELKIDGKVIESAPGTDFEPKLQLPVDAVNYAIEAAKKIISKRDASTE